MASLFREPTVAATDATIAESRNKKLFFNSRNMWWITRILLLLSPLVLFLPFVRIASIGGRTNYTLSAFHILIGNHGLDAELTDPHVLNPGNHALWGVIFLGFAILLAWVLAKKPNILVIPVSVLSFLFFYFGSSMFTWLTPSGGELQFGFHLYMVLQIFIILATFIGVILKRVLVETGTFKSHLAMFGMLTPGLIWLVVFAYLPLPGLLISFKRYVVYGSDVLENFFKSDWVMLRNFRFLFTTPDAAVITRNTVLYNVTFIIIGLVASVALAIAISEMPHRGAAKVYQTTYFLPYFLSWIVVGYLTFALFNYNLGILNTFLGWLNLEPIEWYRSPRYWPAIFLIANLWKYTGYNSIIYIATISGFDQEIYEAAAIDGASRWQQVRRLTLPMLTPIMVLLSILAVGRIFQADLGMFLTLPMGAGPLRNVSNVIDLYVFNAIRSGVNIGLPSAAAFYQSVVGFTLVLVTNGVVRKINPDNALF